MIRRFALALGLSSLAMATSQASELEIALNDSTAQLEVADRRATANNQSSRYGLGVLYNESEDLMATGFLEVTNRDAARWQPMTFSVGTKLFGVDLAHSSSSVAALSLGGNVGIGIPADVPLELVLQGYISPNITTISSHADRVTETTVRLEAEILSGAHAFLGFRQIALHANGHSDAQIDDGLHAGIRLRY